LTTSPWRGCGPGRWGFSEAAAGTERCSQA
jgi:hypothetical protein